MIRVYLESPYGSDDDLVVERNRRYLQACVRDCLRRDEAPFASHQMYTDALDDRDPVQRALGIEAGAAHRAGCDRTVVYTDLGTTPGMEAGVCASEALGHAIVYRALGGEWNRKQEETDVRP